MTKLTISDATRACNVVRTTIQCVVCMSMIACGTMFHRPTGGVFLSVRLSTSLLALRCEAFSQLLITATMLTFAGTTNPQALQGTWGTGERPLHQPWGILWLYHVRPAFSLRYIWT